MWYLLETHLDSIDEIEITVLIVPELPIILMSLQSKGQKDRMHTRSPVRVQSEHSRPSSVNPNVSLVARSFLQYPGAILGPRVHNSPTWSIGFVIRLSRPLVSLTSTASNPGDKDKAVEISCPGGARVGSRIGAGRIVYPRLIRKRVALRIEVRRTWITYTL